MSERRDFRAQGHASPPAEGESLMPSFPKPESRVVARTARDAARAKQRRLVYAAVNVRDNYHCAACGKPADPRALEMTRHGHHHHITFRSQGGQDTTANICLLCPVCHADVHAHRLTISGNADKKLTIRSVE